jgi:hypothetical protein
MVRQELSELAADLTSRWTHGEGRGSEGSDLNLSSEAVVALSVIITVVGTEPLLRRCLARLVPQVEGRPIEVIVPYDGTAGWVAALQKEFPCVRFANMGAVRTTCPPGTAAAAHELYDRRKAFGLNMAQGEILALLDDSSVPDPDWCDRVVEAHHLTHGVIGGCVEYEGRGVLSWAVYLQDFGRYQRPLPDGPARSLTDINVSYKRHALLAVHDVWRERYSEALVHGAMVREGITLWQHPQIVVRQDRGPLSLRGTLVERYSWGRIFGSVRARELSLSGRLFYLVLGPALPLILVLRVAKKRVGTRQRGGFLLALPCLLFLTTAWCLGEFLGNLTGRESSS